MSAKPKIYLGISDVHVPYHSKPALHAFCQLAKDLKPDGFYINGDFLDLLELSKHAKDSVAQLEGARVKDTFDAGNQVLDQLDNALGKQCTDKHFNDGNHEDRIRRWCETGNNAVWIGDDSVSIGKRLRFLERGYSYHYGYPHAHFKLGHLVVTHGKYTTKYAAATHLERYGCSVLVGHCHVPGMFYGSAFDKQRAGFVAGHLANANSKAMQYAPKPNAWRQGFSIVYVEPNGVFHVQLIQFVDGKFCYGGKLYGEKK